MSWPRVFALRLVLLLAGAIATVAASVLVSRSDRTDRSLGAIYACPMHREVNVRAPGRCPICGMELTAVAARKDDARPYFVPEVSEISVARRRLVAQVVNAPAWVDRDDCIVALTYAEDGAALAADEQGSFFSAATPELGVRVVRYAGEGPSSREASTSLIRFRLKAPAPTLRAGDLGRLVLAPRAHEVLFVPAAAVLESAEGPYVLVPDGPLARRPVILGKTTAGFSVVLSGLHEEERVVARDAFFIEAELRMHGR